jgi:hypothetical protein
VPVRAEATNLHSLGSLPRVSRHAGSRHGSSQGLRKPEKPHIAASRRPPYHVGARPRVPRINAIPERSSAENPRPQHDTVPKLKLQHSPQRYTASGTVTQAGGPPWPRYQDLGKSNARDVGCAANDSASIPQALSRHIWVLYARAGPRRNDFATRVATKSLASPHDGIRTEFLSRAACRVQHQLTVSQV